MVVAQSTPRTRLDAQDRRRQLIGIGLRMLATRPIHQITVDEVAASAGISRSLLFHYFDTKQDYYAAVVRAAGRRLLRQVAPDPAGPPEARIRAMVDNYVRYFERRREAYVALFRRPGADDWVRSIHDSTQDALAGKVIEALGGEQPIAEVEMVIRAWWSFAEELAIAWTGREPSDRDGLVNLLTETLHRVIGAAKGESTR
ncbi:MAG TPA: TetR/AcrR family transcriptional regulator [Actinophytocola sp.]|uniref:TetR/AcrR family transcriptional regulator n=1 Tax=Actinophytocola sp. TaxID=1872138 RepID=UPI002DB66AD6|nr:TetR/AcrR family transcriptional regulator [Actinophytocola sp.]HEU5472510.1 TetR/AcrR family transcriptional regulator [Actinophytocola sp.]